MVEEPVTFTVGAVVSAKYKGAFCEAKVKNVEKCLKYKVAFINEPGSSTVNDDQVSGNTVEKTVGSIVKVSLPNRTDLLEATVVKILDMSLYTVVFDDGDITTLRRPAINKRGNPVIDKSSLSHAEISPAPSLSIGRTSRRRVPLDDEDVEKALKSQERRNTTKEQNVGIVVRVEAPDKRNNTPSWFPGLVVAPCTLDNLKVNAEENYLVRSFSDGRYYTVPKDETTRFERYDGKERIDDAPLRLAVEKANAFLVKNELPAHWDRECLFGIENDTTTESSSEEESDDETRQEKDHFIAQFLKYLYERGSSMDVVPKIANKEVDLYKLFKAVYNKGGYTRVCNNNLWSAVCKKAGFGPNQINSVKSFYNKHLHSFEELNKKLGCTLSSKTESQTNRPLLCWRDRALLKRFGSTSDASPSTYDCAHPRRSRRKVKENLSKPKYSDDSDDTSNSENVFSALEEKKVETKAAKKDTSLEREVQIPTHNSKIRRKRGRKGNKKEELVSEEGKQEGNTVKRKRGRPKLYRVEEDSSEDMNKDAAAAAWKNRMLRDSVTKYVESIRRKFNTEKKCNIGKYRKFSTDGFASRGKSPDTKNGTHSDQMSVISVESGKLSRSSSSDSLENLMTFEGKIDNKKLNMQKFAPGMHKKFHQKIGGRGGKRGTIYRQKDDVVEIYPMSQTISIGDKLQIYCPPTQQHNVIYEGKVTNQRIENGVVEYLVHYTGWNTRYDEWIRRSRIACKITETSSRDQINQLPHEQLDVAMNTPKRKSRKRERTLSEQRRRSLSISETISRVVMSYTDTKEDEVDDSKKNDDQSSEKNIKFDEEDNFYSAYESDIPDTDNENSSDDDYHLPVVRRTRRKTKGEKMKKSKSSKGSTDVVTHGKTIIRKKRGKRRTKEDKEPLLDSTNDTDAKSDDELKETIIEKKESTSDNNSLKDFTDEINEAESQSVGKEEECNDDGSRKVSEESANVEEVNKKQSGQDMNNEQLELNKEMTDTLERECIDLYEYDNNYLNFPSNEKFKLSYGDTFGTSSLDCGESFSTTSDEEELCLNEGRSSVNIVGYSNELASNLENEFSNRPFSEPPMLYAGYMEDETNLDEIIFEGFSPSETSKRKHTFHPKFIKNQYNLYDMSDGEHSDVSSSSSGAKSDCSSVASTNDEIQPTESTTCNERVPNKYNATLYKESNLSRRGLNKITSNSENIIINVDLTLDDDDCDDVQTEISNSGKKESKKGTTDCALINSNPDKNSNGASVDNNTSNKLSKNNDGTNDDEISEEDGDREILISGFMAVLKKYEEVLEDDSMKAILENARFKRVDKNTKSASTEKETPPTKEPNKNCKANTGNDTNNSRVPTDTPTKTRTIENVKIIDSIDICDDSEGEDEMGSSRPSQCTLPNNQESENLIGEEHMCRMTINEFRNRRMGKRNIMEDLNFIDNEEDDLNVNQSSIIDKNRAQNDTIIPDKPSKIKPNSCPEIGNTVSDVSVKENAIMPEAPKSVNTTTSVNSMKTGYDVRDYEYVDLLNGVKDNSKKDNCGIKLKDIYGIRSYNDDIPEVGSGDKCVSHDTESDNDSTEYRLIHKDVSGDIAKNMAAPFLQSVGEYAGVEELIAVLSDGIPLEDLEFNKEITTASKENKDSIPPSAVESDDKSKISSKPEKAKLKKERKSSNKESREQEENVKRCKSSSSYSDSSRRLSSGKMNSDTEKDKNKCSNDKKEKNTEEKRKLKKDGRRRSDVDTENKVKRKNNRKSSTKDNEDISGEISGRKSSSGSNTSYHGTKGDESSTHMSGKSDNKKIPFGKKNDEGKKESHHSSSKHVKSEIDERKSKSCYSSNENLRSDVDDKKMTKNEKITHENQKTSHKESEKSRRNSDKKRNSGDYSETKREKNIVKCPTEENTGRERCKSDEGTATETKEGTIEVAKVDEKDTESMETGKKIERKKSSSKSSDTADCDKRRRDKNEKHKRSHKEKESELSDSDKVKKKRKRKHKHHSVSDSQSDTEKFVIIENEKKASGSENKTKRSSHNEDEENKRHKKNSENIKTDEMKIKQDRKNSESLDEEKVVNKEQGTKSSEVKYNSDNKIKRKHSQGTHDKEGAVEKRVVSKNEGDKELLDCKNVTKKSSNETKMKDAKHEHKINETEEGSTKKRSKSDDIFDITGTDVIQKKKSKNLTDYQGKNEKSNNNCKNLFLVDIALAEDNILKKTCAREGDLKRKKSDHNNDKKKEKDKKQRNKESAQHLSKNKSKDDVETDRKIGCESDGEKERSKKRKTVKENKENTYDTKKHGEDKSKSELSMDRKKKNRILGESDKEDSGMKENTEKGTDKARSKRRKSAIEDKEVSEDGKDESTDDGKGKSKSKGDVGVDRKRKTKSCEIEADSCKKENTERRSGKKRKTTKEKKSQDEKTRLKQHRTELTNFEDRKTSGSDESPMHNPVSLQFDEIEAPGKVEDTTNEKSNTSQGSYSPKATTDGETNVYDVDLNIETIPTTAISTVIVEDDKNLINQLRENIGDVDQFVEITAVIDTVQRSPNIIEECKNPSFNTISGHLPNGGFVNDKGGQDKSVTVNLISVEVTTTESDDFFELDQLGFSGFSESPDEISAAKEISDVIIRNITNSTIISNRVEQATNIKEIATCVNNPSVKENYEIIQLSLSNVSDSITSDMTDTQDLVNSEISDTSESVEPEETTINSLWSNTTDTIDFDADDFTVIEHDTGTWDPKYNSDFAEEAISSLNESKDITYVVEPNETNPSDSEQSASENTEIINLVTPEIHDLVESDITDISDIIESNYDYTSEPNILVVEQDRAVSSYLATDSPEVELSIRNIPDVIEELPTSTVEIIGPDSTGDFKMAQQNATRACDFTEISTDVIPSCNLNQLCDFNIEKQHTSSPKFIKPPNNIQILEVDNNLSNNEILTTTELAMDGHSNIDESPLTYSSNYGQPVEKEISYDEHIVESYQSYVNSPHDSFNVDVATVDPAELKQSEILVPDRSESYWNTVDHTSDMQVPTDFLQNDTAEISNSTFENVGTNGLSTNTTTSSSVILDNIETTEHEHTEETEDNEEITSGSENTIEYVLEYEPVNVTTLRNVRISESFSDDSQYNIITVTEEHEIIEYRQKDSIASSFKMTPMASERVLNTNSTLNSEDFITEHMEEIEVDDSCSNTSESIASEVNNEFRDTDNGSDGISRQLNITSQDSNSNKEMYEEISRNNSVDSVPVIQEVSGVQLAQLVDRFENVDEDQATAEDQPGLGKSITDEPDNNYVQNNSASPDHNYNEDENDFVESSTVDVEQDYDEEQYSDADEECTNAEEDFYGEEEFDNETTGQDEYDRYESATNDINLGCEDENTIQSCPYSKEKYFSKLDGYGLHPLDKEYCWPCALKGIYLLGCPECEEEFKDGIPESFKLEEYENDGSICANSDCEECSIYDEYAKMCTEENGNSGMEQDIEMDDNVDENVDMGENVDSDENEDIDESVNVDENVDSDENEDMDENVDTGDNVDSDGNEDMDENVEMGENVDSDGNNEEMDENMDHINNNDDQINEETVNGDVPAGKNFMADDSSQVDSEINDELLCEETIPNSPPVGQEMDDFDHYTTHSTMNNNSGYVINDGVRQMGREQQNIFNASPPGTPEGSFYSSSSSSNGDDGLIEHPCSSCVHSSYPHYIEGEVEEEEEDVDEEIETETDDEEVEDEEVEEEEEDVEEEIEGDDKNDEEISNVQVHRSVEYGKRKEELRYDYLPPKKRMKCLKYSYVIDTEDISDNNEISNLCCAENPATDSDTAAVGYDENIAIDERAMQVDCRNIIEEPEIDEYGNINREIYIKYNGSEAYHKMQAEASARRVQEIEALLKEKVAQFEQFKDD